MYKLSSFTHFLHASEMARRIWAILGLLLILELSVWSFVGIKPIG